MKRIPFSIALALIVILGCDSINPAKIKAIASPEAGKMRELLIQQTSPGQSTYLNGELSVEYGHIFDGMQGAGLQGNPWIVKDVDNPTIESIEIGTAIFNGRRIPSGIIQAHIEMIDRQAGMKKTNFLAIAGINDSEFDMWRNIRVCTDEKNAQAVIASWKVSHSFQ